ncbi:Glycosyl hydrolase, all-beta [Sesbania bispinosa]|nr:Glycosyl hydrolase, all-beta [Sesbania bispinosa]
MTAETLEILSNEEVIAVWAGLLSGNRLVVALWNRCSKVTTITASWKALGLESGIHVSVRDL